MKWSTIYIRNCPSGTRAVPLLVAALALAGCETTGSGPAQPAEPPMTRSRAATECWMKTEKNARDMNLDKRADIVTKCIEDKMKAAAPATAPKT